MTFYLVTIRELFPPVIFPVLNFFARTRSRKERERVDSERAVFVNSMQSS